ncbi:S1 domain-containing RNA-binding protein [Tepidibacillus infernus]|uniref:RNA-binding protein S1 n=1 Tax=Tepidibacillus decaturensis TaxID=1413211 RepID=A0A135L798_9BACI|nr:MULTISPECIES: S1 domain-containing RNA-binding protein [Tepidibacillus]KXG44850.1 RNA-binding protein S1 [Tepidibacillus decaturensis]GBF11390.1 general stress protein 13 [Tepidibacillus sp. HK-1]
MSIEIGSKVKGKVTGITHFGAFIELPSGETGLIHISEIADSYVKDVNEFLKVNDMITVKVINVEKDGKIGLSLKKAQEKPVEHTPKERPQKSTRRQSNESFDDKLNKFLKDSEERLSTLRKSTDSKRGGRGARRG